MAKKGIKPFFENTESWKKLWKGLPDFIQGSSEPAQTISIHFMTEEDREDFAKLVNQKITANTRFMYYPKLQHLDWSKKICDGGDPQSKYPIYIISKGRWESRLTSKTLERINVPYHIVVEPQEYDNYAAVIDPKKILTLPFSNLGRGSIPARNWVMQHSKDIGAEKHWILDDNISHFFRLYRNIKYIVNSGTIFRVIEDFTDRYENLAMAGMEYQYFIPRKSDCAPFRLNTRIYSCILIDNNIPFKWRGKYNEDTDLSLRCLKAGWCTMLFQAFLCGKISTQTMKGGNTDNVYIDGDERMKFAESLQKQHPDVVKIVRRYNRWHHEVDYSQFQKPHTNQLKLKKGVEIKDEINNYGMIFKNLDTDENSED
jgi:hypothetical protein